MGQEEKRDFLLLLPPEDVRRDVAFAPLTEFGEGNIEPVLRKMLFQK